MDIEYQSAEAIKRFQEERLVVALDYLKRNSPYYQRLFKNNHIAMYRKEGPSTLQLGFFMLSQGESG